MSCIYLNTPINISLFSIAETLTYSELYIQLKRSKNYIQIIVNVQMSEIENTYSFSGFVQLILNAILYDIFQSTQIIQYKCSKS